jgi:hypothetical protein
MFGSPSRWQSRSDSGRRRCFSRVASFSRVQQQGPYGSTDKTTTEQEILGSSPSTDSFLMHINIMLRHNICCMYATGREGLVCLQKAVGNRFLQALLQSCLADRNWAPACASYDHIRLASVVDVDISFTTLESYALPAELFIRSTPTIYQLQY